MSPRILVAIDTRRMRPSYGCLRAWRRLLAWGFLAVGSSAPITPGLEAQIGDSIPIDLTFARRELAGQDRAALANDGARLAYVVRTPPSESPRASRFLPNGVPVSVVGSRVLVTDLGTGDTREVGPATGHCWRPSWSPDGDSLAFYCDAEGVPHLWVHDVASGASRRVTDTPVKAKLWAGDEPLWSPDGRLIYVPLAPHDLETPPAQPEPPAVSSSGARVTVYRSLGSAQEEVREDPDNQAWTDHFMRENNASIAVVDPAMGAVRVLAPATASPPPSVMRVSPTGRWVSYLSVFHKPTALETTMYHDLAIVSAAGGPVRVLARDIPVQEGNYYLGTYLWHPTQDQIFWVDDGRLWMNTPGEEPGMPKRLAANLADLTPAPLGFTRDGSILVVATRSGVLALVPIDGSEPRLIPYPERMDLQDLVTQDAVTAWQPVSNTLTLIFRDLATTEDAVLRFDLGSGAARTLWKGLARIRVAGGPVDHTWIAASIEDMNTPGNLYRLDESFGNRQQLSDVEPRLAGFGFGPVETFETRVPRYDGSMTTVTTAVLLPPGRSSGERHPALVFIYPGSRVSRTAAQYGGGMPSTVPVSAFTTRGYAVLLSELPIGPIGQSGQPVAEMVDLLLPQVYRAAELGYIDIDRVAVSGQSYGGYGTAAVLSGTNLFRAGIAIAGLFDLAGRHSSMDERGMASSARWSETGQGRMGTHPWGDLRRYVENSPYYQADRIHTPLLLLHGEADTTTPVEDAGKMFNALRRLGRRAELAVYEGEGHVVNGWALVNAVDATSRMLMFLDEHLKDRGVEPSSRR